MPTQTGSIDLSGDANAAKVATNYIAVDDTGIRIAQSNPATATTYQHQTATETEFFIDGTSMASFGSEARVGAEDESHMELNYHSMQLVDQEGNIFFYAGDLRDRSGKAQISEDFAFTRFMYEDSGKVRVAFPPAVEIVDILYSDGDSILGTSAHAEIVSDGYFISIETADNLAGENGTLVYKTSGAAYSYTLGTRGNGAVGPFSIVAGESCVASGNRSHAEGASTTASGYTAHAEGADTTASGISSHAGGQGTMAGYTAQTAIGKWNNSKRHNLFEIGNGTADNARSNALEVNDSGDVTAAGRFISPAMAGMIQMFGGSTAPTGWLLCNGAAVNRIRYAALFAVIGTTYGAGDGSTTFNLPNLQGRFPLGSSSSYALAATGGSANAIVPYHNHSMTSALTSASVTIAENKAGTASTGISDIMRDTNGIGTVTATNYAGSSGNATGANMPPYVAVNYIICTGI